MPDTQGDANQDSASREDAIDRPLEYLFAASGASIESFHLSRLNAVANLRKELHEIFEEWVEAEVQARLAQWLLARKDSEAVPAAGSLTMGSAKDSNAQIVNLRAEAANEIAGARSGSEPALRSVTASGPRTTSRRSAAANSSIRRRAAGGKIRTARALNPKITTRPIITRSAIASRTRRFPLFIHPSAALRSPNISKPSKATSALLSLRRPNRNSMAS